MSQQNSIINRTFGPVVLFFNFLRQKLPNIFHKIISPKQVF